MKVLDHASARQMLLCCADAIISSKPLLTEVDSRIGDGDHGIGMSVGMEKVKEVLQGMESERNVYDLFRETGKAMLMSMGGASGVIFGTMFMGGTKGGSPAESMDTAAFAEMMREALAAVKLRGKAEVGDKTMVDAFEPAVDAMLAYPGQDFEGMLAAAEEAAAAGVERTKEIPAKFGRAKFLGERSVGCQDAGATSVWLLFQAMRRYAAGQ